MGRWRVAAGSLVPLLPAALFLLVDVGESSSVVLLVAAVVVATILGGTELPLLLSSAVIADVPALDTTALHVAAIVRRLRSARRERPR